MVDAFGGWEEAGEVLWYLIELKTSICNGLVKKENGRSAARDGDFSIVDAVVDVGGGCDEEGVILTPQPSPTVAVEVGRMVLKFDVD
jgi:hypothetical protein